jgi:hypothetical protein
MKLHASRARIALAALASALGLATIAFGCSSSPPPTPAACDPKLCKPGNTCINDGKATACRLPCTSNEGPGSCPFNYHCVDAQGAVNGADGKSYNYCAPDRTAYTKKDGQWGASCSPSGGLENNPSCDSTQNFWCYGVSPTDGNAFCTQYGCTDDLDCKAGWWCATINATPDVRTTTRQFGEAQVTTVCLPRVWNQKPGTYCAPCKTDLDCPTNEGRKQHCADPGDGQPICAAECSKDSECTLDARCVPDYPTAGVSTCLPRAGTCKGDGKLCSPCRADTDCTDGVCALAAYSTEHFCTQKSGVPCSGQTRQCPTPPQGAAPAGVGCVTDSSGDIAPKDQCFGGYNLMSNGVPGCWTKPR